MSEERSADTTDQDETSGQRQSGHDGTPGQEQSSHDETSGQEEPNADATYDAVATVLADDVASGILRESYAERQSAHELAETLDASPPTVYRRLETLREHDLVVTATRPDPDGHHTDVYRTNVDRVVVELDADGFSVDVRRRETKADRFTRIIEDI